MINTIKSARDIIISDEILGIMTKFYVISSKYEYLATGEGIIVWKKEVVRIRLSDIIDLTDASHVYYQMANKRIIPWEDIK